MEEIKKLGELVDEQIAEMPVDTETTNKLLTILMNINKRIDLIRKEIEEERRGRFYNLCS